jgi:hypothetical protein
VVDGPFAETKELVAGLWILQGESLEEIVELMLRRSLPIRPQSRRNRPHTKLSPFDPPTFGRIGKGAPNPDRQPGTVEIRPLVEIG